MLEIRGMKYSPRNITVACDHKGLTHFGGVYFFHEFLRVLQLRHFLARQLRYRRQNHRYSVSQMIPGFSLPISARAGSAGNGVIPTFQRHVPVFDGIAKLSRSANTETFLTASARVVLETDAHGQ